MSMQVKAYGVNDVITTIKNIGKVWMLNSSENRINKTDPKTNEVVNYIMPPVLDQTKFKKTVTEGVDVKPLTGLLVDFCHEVGAGGVVKGLRAITDFEYELQQASLNSRLAPDIESIFVMSSPEYGYVSSSIVRELASFGSDVDLLVPPSVSCALKQHFAQAR